MPRFNGFSGDYSGLNASELSSRHQQYGLNEIIPEKKVSVCRKLLDIFKEPMFLLLLGASLLYFVLGEPKDGIIMIAFVLCMAGINFIQEWRTDRTLQALKDLSAPKTRTIRDGRMISVESKDLTVGDLIILEEGERISADGRILEMFDLGIDESSLTGESETVWKKIDLTGEDLEAHWRRDYIYAGTFVVQGSAIVEITAIGVNTAYGKIGQDIMSAPLHPTPMEKQTRHLIKICALIGTLLLVMVFAVNLLHNQSIIASILSGVTLAMAIIPEEFPVILTVFLAMGAWRLARKQALVRRMPSVETLGAVSVLCVDKTGTLTQNKMSVQKLYAYRDLSEKELLYWAALGCESEPYDSMEKAILKKAEQCGLVKAELFDKKLLSEYPFSAETKMMGHIWSIDNAPELAAKGSPESILPLCRLTPGELSAIRQQQNEMAVHGYRVIAVARRRQMSSIPAMLQDNELEFLGLIGLEDPPREEVPHAIAVCAQAGIRVIMITGDNGTTAQSIARKIGIANSDRILTGPQLEKMSDEELRRQLVDTNIFARVIPVHKMRIVKALKDMGRIVAMTGDGVNDATALKYADIGIAMGQRGTGVAKEAADMILLDDNFTTIVETVKDGRRIYDNIKKAIGYVFVIHIPIAMTALLTPVLHLPPLLLPIHVVLLELIVDPTCSIIFERQPAEKDLMDKPPRAPFAPLLSWTIIVKAFVQGIAILGATLGSYIWLTGHGETVEAARSFTLLVMVFANLSLVFVNQSDKDFAFSSKACLKDPVIWLVNLAIFTALTLAIFTPFGNTIAKVQPLTTIEIAVAVALAAGVTFWWELVKVIKRRQR